MSDNKNNKISVGIINLEFHNLFSIYHALKSLGYKVTVYNLKQAKYNSDILILPGVGSFNFAMKKVRSNNIDMKIQDFLQKKKLLFGICLGMQLLFEESDEFVVTKGMGFIKGNVENFSKKNFKVPHIGWEKIKKTRHTNLLNNNDYYYFVHSLFCRPKNKKTILSLTNYQGFNYCSSIHVDNIFATQFHPEKSGESGLKILSNMKKLI